MQDTLSMNKQEMVTQQEEKFWLEKQKSHFNKKYRNLDNKDGLKITEKELVAVLMRESNFKKTTFCFKGDPIPFSVVKEVLNLSVEYE